MKFNFNEIKELHEITINEKERLEYLINETDEESILHKETLIKLESVKSIIEKIENIQI